MKVLITGANGQLGNEILDIINSGKAEIGEVSKIIKNSDVLAVDVDKLDITNLEQVRTIVKDFKADVIINCAAATNVDGCESNESFAFKVNAIGPRNLAIVAEEIGAKLVQVSTDYVFNGEKKLDFNGKKKLKENENEKVEEKIKLEEIEEIEEIEKIVGIEEKIGLKEYERTNPKTVYGKTKLLGEQYVRSFSSKYFIIRTAWLYGYKGHNFVYTMMKLGKEKESIKVVNDQIGNPTNANDLAYHILKLIETEEYGIYHCTGEGNCSWYDFAKEIMELNKLDCKVNPCSSEEYKTVAKRPNYSALDNLMLKSIGMNEMRDWKIALKSFINNTTK
ncbi:MAG: SDR family oxidoreductase [Sarcina sp.]